MIMVDDHRPAENMEILHHIFLHVSQRGDVGVVTCRTHKYMKVYTYCTVYPKLLRWENSYTICAIILLIPLPPAFRYYFKSNTFINQTSENLMVPKDTKLFFFFLYKKGNL